MPSGSYVNVNHWTTNGRANLHIYVYPLRADAYQTTGLCGNYNLNWADDGPASGRYCTSACERHR